MLEHRADARSTVIGGAVAGSIVLVGYGLDCVVEVSSALVIAWRLSRRGSDHAANERAERPAVRLIALSFFGVAAYVAGQAVLALLGVREEPQPSPLRLAITALSLVVVPTLAWAKRHVPTGLSAVALRADAAEMQLCTYLFGVVLLRMSANQLLGWWRMDPVAGHAVAALALREGREAWARGGVCDC